MQGVRLPAPAQSPDQVVSSGHLTCPLEVVTLPGSTRLRLREEFPHRADGSDAADGVQQVYAIFTDGDHQYRVEEGQTVEVQIKDLDEGVESIEFDRVLFIGDVEDGPKIGRPLVEGAKVKAAILGEFKGQKLVIQKHRRRKNSSRKTGHRQRYLHVKIEKIEV